MTASASFSSAARRPQALLVTLCLGFGLAGINLLNGATMEFSLLAGLFVVLTYFAVRACGGITTMFGAIIAYLAFQHVIGACLGKFLVGQPVEARLDAPDLTMQIYCVAMVSLGVGGYFGSRLARRYKKVLFVPIEDPKLLKSLAWVSIFAEVVRIIVFHSRFNELASGPQESGGAASVVIAMQFIPLLAVACATANCVLESNGKKCVNWLVALAVLPTIASGVAGANRGDAATAVGAWLVTALAFGFRFRMIHLAAMGVLGYFAVYIFFPYARYARAFIRGADFQTNMLRAVAILEDVIENPAKYQDASVANAQVLLAKRSQNPLHQHWIYYIPENETLERFALIKSTDRLVYNSLKREPWGWQTIEDGLVMAVPSTFVEDKPIWGDNNLLGHMVPGMLPPKDIVTQPNTGMFADSFVSFRWYGVALCLGTFMFLFNVIYGYVTRAELRRNVYGLALVLMLAHTISEGSMASEIGGCTTTVIYAVLGLGFLRAVASVVDLDRFPNIARLRSIRRRRAFADAPDIAEA